MKMGQIESPETLVFNLNQTLGNYPEEYNFNKMNHSESLKFNMCCASSEIRPVHVD
jgi:hypothetical protein